MGFRCLFILFIVGGGGSFSTVSAAIAATLAPDDLPAVQPKADDWPWWHGPNRDSIAVAGQQPPLHWLYCLDAKHREFGNQANALD